MQRHPPVRGEEVDILSFEFVVLVLQFCMCYERIDEMRRERCGDSSVGRYYEMD